VPLNLDAVGTETAPSETSWTSKDALLYALGVGAGALDPAFELEFTTENTAGVEQRVLPTFAVIVGQGRAGGGSSGLTALEALGPFDRAKLLHGPRAPFARPPASRRSTTRGRARS
jgi:hypothetical protein